MQHQLWYICKRLTNPERVDALRKVMLAHDPMTVSNIAESLRLKEPATSLYLSQLELDCGLVAPIREGRYVSYAPEPDPDDPRCEILVRIFKEFFKAEAERLKLPLALPQPAPAFVWAFPALANEGRAKICIHLRRHGKSSIAALMKLLGQCDAGIRRHIGIIAKAGLCAWSNGICSWQEPDDPILIAFLSLVEKECAQPT